MEPISNADRLAMLLRQKLRERAKASQSPKGGSGEKSNVATPQEPSGIKALAGVAGTDDRPLRRAVIQNILADQLGPSLLNDAQFQQVVTRVTDTIEDDPDAAQLLTRVIADLRS